jgi:dihydroorotase
VVSDHSPLDEESKKLEFDLAEFGIIGLETAFAVLHTHNPGLPLEQLVGKFAVGPRDVLGLPLPELAEGAPANLTLFDPQAQWQFTLADIRSKSRNTPFVGARFTGRVVGIIHQGRASLHRAGGSRQLQ